MSTQTIPFNTKSSKVKRKRCTNTHTHIMPSETKDRERINRVDIFTTQNTISATACTIPLSLSVSLSISSHCAKRHSNIREIAFFAEILISTASISVILACVCVHVPVCMLVLLFFVTFAHIEYEDFSIINSCNYVKIV